MFDPFLVLLLLVALADGQLSRPEAVAIASMSTEVSSAEDVRERAIALEGRTTRQEAATALRQMVATLEAPELASMLRSAYGVANDGGSTPAEVGVIDDALGGRNMTTAGREAAHAWARRAAALEAEGVALLQRSAPGR